MFKMLNAVIIQIKGVNDDLRTLLPQSYSALNALMTNLSLKLNQMFIREDNNQMK